MRIFWHHPFHMDMSKYKRYFNFLNSFHWIKLMTGTNGLGEIYVEFCLLGFGFIVYI